jgi:hypothetical protein
MREILRLCFRTVRVRMPVAVLRISLAEIFCDLSAKEVVTLCWGLVKLALCQLLSEKKKSQ